MSGCACSRPAGHRRPRGGWPRRGAPPRNNHRTHAGGRVPAAVASLQHDPATDWMYDGDPGGVGKGLIGGQMMVPRGKMLGGSSGLNYIAYVRGHPSDFDSWAAGGADGWSYEEVLPYFRKAEGFVNSPELQADPDVHGHNGPVGVSVRQPILPASLQFVDAPGAPATQQ